MSIQFPANPPLNDTFDYDDKTYIWDGEKWTASAIGSFDEAYVNISGDTMTGDLTVPSLNGGPLAGMRNQIINGDFRVWQRGTSFTNAGVQIYTADRWKETGLGVGGNAVTSLSDDAPAGFSSSIELTPNAGVLQHGIELPLNSSGDATAGPFAVGTTWTFSVWSTLDLTAWTTAVAFRNGVGLTTGQSTAASTVPNWAPTGEPASNGFTRYKITFTIDGTPAAANRCLNVFLHGGGNARKFAGAQLEPGPVATPFEIRPIGTELALCQRYYQTVDRMQLFAPNANSTNKVLSVPRTVTMRTNPSETGTVSNGTLGLTGTTLNYQVEADGVSQSVASFLSNYTADAEL